MRVSPIILNGYEARGLFTSPSAIKSCGLEPRRVDKHNEGGLLKSEIIRFIQDSDILIADLTNERQNVYLEIGYAMGIDKFKNLILTVREDHFPDSPNYKKGGPKIHFDLSGYDVLGWSSDNLSAFCEELEKRIRRRLILTTRTASTAVTIWDPDWVVDQRKQAEKANSTLGYSGYMEIRAALHLPKVNKTQTELSEAARTAELRSPFGWPIAAYLNNRDDARPKPRTDGISAEIQGVSEKTYDYWAIRRNGDFYFYCSLFEDVRRPGQIFFNTRIVRVTEALLYLMRLYTNLGLDRSSRFSVAVRHGGLRGRILSGTGERTLLGLPRKCEEELSDEEVSGSIDEFEKELVGKVETLLSPLFRLFEFFELGRPIYEDIVNKFIKGIVS
jgi:hypothetical protein